MRMSFLIPAIALALPVTAMAASQPEEDVSVDEARVTAPRVADVLADPALQHGIATGIAVAGQALLDVQVAPLIEAIERARGEEPSVDPDTRLRDLAGPDAENVTYEAAARVPQVLGAMSGVARGIGDMTPALKGMIDQVRRNLPSGYLDRSDR